MYEEHEMRVVNFDRDYDYVVASSVGAVRQDGPSADPEYGK